MLKQKKRNLRQQRKAKRLKFHRQMKDYLQESIDESGLNIVHEAATPAKGNLFDVDSESPPLEGEEFEVFRSVVAKLL